MIGDLVKNVAEPLKNSKVLILVEKHVVNYKLLDVFNKISNVSKNTQFVIYPNKEKHEDIYPDEVREMIEKSDIIIDCCFWTDMYSEFKQKLLKKNKKIVYLIRPFDECLKSFELDLQQIETVVEKTNIVSEFLKNNSKIKINNLITATVGDRPILKDGVPVDFGKDTILPMASVSFAPMEDSINGEIHIKGFFETVKGESIKFPIDAKLTFENGKLIDIEGVNANKVKEIMSAMDEEAKIISHITFGTNPFIKDAMDEVFLIERKTKGMTIGLGNNQGAFKGQNKSKNHIDFSGEFKKLKIISNSNSIEL